MEPGVRAIRVLRVLEYTYPDVETMTADMERWGVGANATKAFKPGHAIKSATMMPEVALMPTVSIADVVLLDKMREVVDHYRSYPSSHEPNYDMDTLAALVAEAEADHG